jgi:hypothetical protein
VEKIQQICTHPTCYSLTKRRTRKIVRNKVFATIPSPSPCKAVAGGEVCRFVEFFPLWATFVIAGKSVHRVVHELCGRRVLEYIKGNTPLFFATRHNFPRVTNFHICCTFLHPKRDARTLANGPRLHFYRMKGSAEEVSEPWGPLASIKPKT